MTINQPVFPPYFADAETDYPAADFILFGVPYDKTSSFRFGSAQGPAAIRHASWNFEAFNLLTDIDFSDLNVHDYGNIEEVNNLNPAQMIKKVSTFSKKLWGDQKIPVCFGGEHSITSGIIESVDPDTFLLIFDAHLDYRDIYENESYNHACTIKRIAEGIPHENISIFGIRSAEKKEYMDAKNDHISMVTSADINKKGITNFLKSLKNKIKNRPVYISIDIDVIDPGFAPGTGTPEPFGLYPTTLCVAFDILYEQLIGFDVMEVNPLFDQGQTASLAAKYIRYGIEKISQIKH